MIISKTPLRMSFAGGGTDFADFYRKYYGAVLSTTINKYVYISVNKRFTKRVRVGYSEIEDVHNVDDIKHNLVLEALKLTGITTSTDIVYTSDLLPASEGSGLGSSSSLLVGTLNAIHAYKGEYSSPEVLAKKSCQIEIDILKSPIGKQDQYAAAYGGLNFIKFNPDESVFVEPIILKKTTKNELENNLLLFYTGTHTRSDIVLCEQKSKIGTNLEILNHMVHLAEELKDSLRNSDLTKFGSILNQNWEYKKKLSTQVSTSVIDKYYQKAMDAGALGGKILGSGGGGFLLFYCEDKNKQKLRDALSELEELPFCFEPQGSRIIYIGD